MDCAPRGSHICFPFPLPSFTRAEGNFMIGQRDTKPFIFSFVSNMRLLSALLFHIRSLPFEPFEGTFVITKVTLFK